MKSVKGARWLWGIAILLVTAFIFSQSLQPAEQPAMYSGAVAGWLGGVLNGLPGGAFLLEHIRKVAHVVEFATLGVCWAGLGRAGARRWWFLLPGPLTATADELLQLTSPGRSAQVSDVLLDSGGYLLGFSLVMMVVLIHSRMCKKNGTVSRSL